MERSSLIWWRRQLIAACLLASFPALWRIGDAWEALQRQRLATAEYGRGEQLRAAGRLAEAMQTFRTAVEYGPAAPGASVPNATERYESLADAQFRLGLIDESITTYRQILKVYPYKYFSRLYRNVGLIELRAGRPRVAREDLYRAVALDPGDWLAYHLLGHALAASGDTQGARAAWTRVLTLNPGFQPARDRLRELDAKRPH